MICLQVYFSSVVSGLLCSLSMKKFALFSSRICTFIVSISLLRFSNCLLTVVIFFFKIWASLYQLFYLLIFSLFLLFFYCCTSTVVSIFLSPLSPTLNPTPLWLCPWVSYAKFLKVLLFESFQGSVCTTVFFIRRDILLLLFRSRNFTLDDRNCG